MNFKIRELNKLDSNKFIPIRLKEARESSGLSMEDLAIELGISRQAISQFEKGIKQPSNDIFNKITNTLEFPANFYTKDFPISYSEGAISFRSVRSTNKKTKTMYSHSLKFLSYIYKYLKSYINFPENNIPVDIDFLEKFDLHDETEDNFNIIEMVALGVREHWQIGQTPIHDLIGVLENNGIVIGKMGVRSEDIDAFSQWIDGTPYIVYGGKRNTKAGQIFSLAHELGHLLLHEELTTEEINGKENRLYEKQANRFASSFLMPAQTFSQHLPYTSSIDAFTNIKLVWNVSIQSMIYRCCDLNIINENKKNNLFKQLSIRGYKKCEPLEDEIQFYNPSMLKDGIELLVENSIETFDSLINNIPIRLKELSALTFTDFSKPRKIRELNLNLKTSHEG